jgi:uncharacterized phosphosugar-binding protein
MVVEIVLVALVLSFVGLAVWQANQHAKKAENATAISTPAAAATADTTAESAAKLVEDDFTADIKISTEAEGAQEDEFSAVAKDAANLEGSFDDSDF